jgi:hypothetical protein
VTTPTLGILVDRPTPPQLADVLAVLRRWCRPIAWDDEMAPPAAWITTSPSIPTSTDAPRAIWIESLDDLSDPGTAGAAVLLCADRRLAAGAERVIAVTGTVDAVDMPWLTPFVRSRYRRARGLPDEMVVRVDDDTLSLLPGGQEIDGELQGTALAMASVAIVRGPALVTALAWGVPCVTDAASATAIGAAGGVHVVIESAGDPYEDAVKLAGDERRAARLSHAGRRFVETTLDRVAPARRVAVALGLHKTAPQDRFDAALDELNTPAAARIRSRARVAVPA